MVVWNRVMIIVPPPLHIKLGLINKIVESFDKIVSEAEKFMYGTITSAASSKIYWLLPYLRSVHVEINTILDS